MRDGVVLYGTLYCPREIGKEPGILIASGYGAAADPYFVETSKRLAEHRYVVLFVKLRGVLPSEGKAGLYEKFGRDGYDLVEWLAQRSECDGRVAMFGASLLGLVQYLAAREAPPSLKVILPDDAGSDNYWYLWHPGGMNAGPGRAARQSVSGAESEYALAVAHPDYDAFWRERSVGAEDLESIARRGIAALITSGWDSYLLGSTKSYEWLKSGEPRKRLKMIIGPWGHGSFLGPRAPMIGPAILPRSGFEYSVLWLDRWLKDVTNGIEDEPPVLIYVQGPNEWRFEPDWPLPDEQRVRLYLRDEPSGTRAGLNDGSLSSQAPRADAPVAYEYSPGGPYNIAAVTTLSRPRVDKTTYEAHGLTWTSAPVSMPIEMTGYPRVTFWSMIAGTDTDFVVEITDVGMVDGSGRLESLQVTRGYLNAMRHFSRIDPRPLVPGRVYCFKLELYPTSYVFAPGHRIRVSLQGSAIDPLARETTVAVPRIEGLDLALLAVPQGPNLNPQATRVTIFQDADHLSFIDLPLIGTVIGEDARGSAVALEST